MVQLKNLNVRVGLLGIIERAVVIGLIVSIVHVRKQRLLKYSLKKKKKKIRMRVKRMMKHRLSLLVKRRNLQQKDENRLLLKMMLTVRIN